MTSIFWFVKKILKYRSVNFYNHFSKDLSENANYLKKIVNSQFIISLVCMIL